MALTSVSTSRRNQRNHREYNGIADRIWTAYTGSWAEDQDPNDPSGECNKTVIWTSRIDW